MKTKFWTIVVNNDFRQSVMSQNISGGLLQEHEVIGLMLYETKNAAEKELADWDTAKFGDVEVKEVEITLL